MDTYLDFARENYEATLQEALDEIASGSSAPESYFTASLSYRVLAICAMLLDANRSVFSDFSCKSGYVRLAFLRRLSSERNVHPVYLCSSRNVAFSAALAAGALEAASEIAARSPDTHSEEAEYEDDFLFFHFMHRALLVPEDAATLKQILTRWEAVLEGGASGYLEVCRALAARDAEDFDQGMGALIETRDAQLDRYQNVANFNPELFATEGKIFVEGLAVLRLAELRGLPTEDDYKYIPSMARIPLGATLPDFDSWRRYS